MHFKTNKDCNNVKFGVEIFINFVKFELFLLYQYLVSQLFLVLNLQQFILPILIINFYL
jgi:hypothetical protein